MVSSPFRPGKTKILRCGQVRTVKATQGQQHVEHHENGRTKDSLSPATTRKSPTSPFFIFTPRCYVISSQVLEQGLRSRNGFLLTKQRNSSTRVLPQAWQGPSCLSCTSACDFFIPQQFPKGKTCRILRHKEPGSLPVGSE